MGAYPTPASLVGYGDLSHRLQYSVGASQDVEYLNTGEAQFAIPEGTPDSTNRDQYIFTRYALRSVAATGDYPFNRFTRIELGASASSTIGRDSVAQNLRHVYRPTDAGYVDENAQLPERWQSLPTLTYFAPILAYVSDNTLAGATGPISGRRYRFSASPAFGNIRWTEYGADYRRYDPVIFNTLTFSTRLFADATVGRDEDLFPKYIGTPDFVRGYDQSSIYSNYTCDSFLGSSQHLWTAVCYDSTCWNTSRVSPTKSSASPSSVDSISGRFPIGLPPVDGLFFYDAGLAWSVQDRQSS